MNLLAALIPYVAVLIGMHGFHSAWLAIILYHLGIVATLVRRSAGSFHRVFSGYRLAVLLPGVLVCALAAPVVYFIWPWLEASDGILRPWLERFGLVGWKWWLLVPYFSMVHPVLEELHWRGIAPRPFRRFCWQDLLFAGYHVQVLFQLVRWPWLVVVFAVLAASSVFWRWSAARFDGYGVAIATHAVADAAIMVAVVLLLIR